MNLDDDYGQRGTGDGTLTVFNTVLEEWRTLTGTGVGSAVKELEYYPFGHFMEGSSSILNLVGKHLRRGTVA